jgi:aspartate kinase
MKVFKFGGASLKDAASIKNVATVLQHYQKQKLTIVVSAMGKTTNALENLCDAYYFQKGDVNKILNEIKDFHFNIIHQLFADKQHPIYNEVSNLFVELDWIIEENPVHSYDQEYDQIVSLGEIVSSKILSLYLNEVGIKNNWMDVRDVLQTDNNYREGKVDWEISQTNALENLLPLFTSKHIVITQGFIGGTSENYTTTLGREGSDYTAAILAYCTNAEEVIIWKDVPGVLNADPKWFNDTVLIPQLSYQDAIELAYYGATVIHPKTIKPLQNKNISLYVKSFVSPEEKGTLINNEQAGLPTPCFIFKVNQVLISIAPKDFSFIAEESLSNIFGLLASLNVKINLMQHSAISFSVCTDFNEQKTPKVIELLQKEFRVLYNKDVELATVRYYDKATIDRVSTNKEVLLEQRSRYTIQLVMRNQK